jgi:cell division protein FtsQ
MPAALSTVHRSLLTTLMHAIRRLGGFGSPPPNIVAVQVVQGIDDAFLLRRRELMRSRGRRRLVVVIALLGAIATFAGYKLLAMSSAFAVTEVHVTGAGKPLERSILQSVEKAVAGKSLLEVDRSAILHDVEANPYVRTARIDRAFPHTLAIEIDMYTPALAVSVSKTTFLIASDGQVLAQVDEAPKKLPQASLPRGSTFFVGRRAGDANIEAALLVLAQQPEGFQQRVGRIKAVIPSEGQVTAVLNDGVKLKLGPPGQLTLKLQIAERALLRIPGNEGRDFLRYIDVSAVGRVAYSYRHLDSVSSTE